MIARRSKFGGGPSPPLLNNGYSYLKAVFGSTNPRNNEALKSSSSCAVYHTFLLAALLVLALTGGLSLFVLAAFSPLLIQSFWHLTNRVRQVNLRLGWFEVIYSIVFLISHNADLPILTRLRKHSAQ